MHALEAELGEALLYRATGRFLASQGLGTVPDVWGLVLLTPTRLVFRHFPQAHPLVGGKDDEVRFELDRSRFLSCRELLSGVWAKLFTGARDLVALEGPGVRLHLDLAADLKEFPKAWNASAGPS